MAKFVGSDEVGFPRYHSLAVVIATRAEPGVEVQRVTVFEVLCKFVYVLEIKKETRTIGIKDLHKSEIIVLVGKVHTWGANSPDRISPWRSDISQSQNSTFELQVCEQVRQAEVFVAVLSTEDLSKEIKVSNFFVQSESRNWVPTSSNVLTSHFSLIML